LATALARVEVGFAEYRLDVVVNALYEFTWHEYCDWYVELSKAVLFSDTAGDAEKRGTRHTLIHVLEVLLRAWHPLAPFISEEIWQRVRIIAGVSGDTLMRAAYPTPGLLEDGPAGLGAGGPDTAAEPEMRWVMDFILGVRQIKGEMDIPLGRKIDVLLQNAGPQDLLYAERNLPYLTRLAGISPPQVLSAGQTAPICAAALLGTLEILVPMAGLIEPTAELERLAKRLDKAQVDFNKLTAKLSNGDFAKNAPREVVAKPRWGN
jgi:valyl-tRNA synthetase